MGKSLLIVESPTKVNTLKKIVGKDFIIKASVGHLKDLPKKKLGVDVENDFEPEYITIRGKGKILQELKTAAKKVDSIYLAPDPDREGEAIAHHIGNEVARFTKGKIYRVMFNEITKKAVKEAIEEAENTKVDISSKKGDHIGPVVSKIQYDKIQNLIQSGIDEGANLAAGGIDRPKGLDKGYFVQPTVFTDVKTSMRIANEEIFGPVISILPFENEEEAISISNDTAYGLTNYIQTKDKEKAHRIAKQLRSGMVEILSLIHISEPTRP